MTESQTNAKKRGKERMRLYAPVHEIFFWNWRILKTRNENQFRACMCNQTKYPCNQLKLYPKTFNNKMKIKKDYIQTNSNHEWSKPKWITETTFKLHMKSILSFNTRIYIQFQIWRERNLIKFGDFCLYIFSYFIMQISQRLTSDIPKTSPHTFRLLEIQS